MQAQRSARRGYAFQKRPTTVSKETYSVKRDLLEVRAVDTQRRRSILHMYPYYMCTHITYI